MLLVAPFSLMSACVLVGVMMLMPTVVGACTVLVL
jgi:hypothetical protein